MIPALSVVMPVRNAARFVRAAVDSVLAQSFRDFEFVVVDDASTDDTPRILDAFADPRLRIVRLERHAGVAAALNAGLARCVAPLVARQDADDVSEPTRFETQVRVFAQNPGIGLIGTQGTVIDEDGRQCGAIDRSLETASIRWYALLDNPFIHSSVMFRRDLASACGNYDEIARPYPQDYALWCRMLARADAINLTPRLVRYRVNRASVHGPLVFGTASDDYRRRFAAAVAGIVERNLAALPGPPVPPADARLLATFIPGVPAEHLSRFLDLFDELLRRYRQAHSLRDLSGDFRRTLARQYDAVAVRVQPPSRGAAVRVYGQALRRHPRLAGRLHWPRVIALAVCGHAGRERAGRAWRRGIRRAA